MNLPKGINKLDTTRPKFFQGVARGKDGTDYLPHEYELYYTERFGWCMTTLLIGKASRRARGRGVETDRYYGVIVEPGKEGKRGDQVRIGHGPHVKEQITVYVREQRLEKLQWLIDLYNKGMEGAHDTRDRISSRRAATSRRRASDPYSFLF